MMDIRNSRNSPGTSPNGDPYRVLIIEDSAFFRKQLSLILSSAGFSIVGEAHDGEIGFNLYKENHPMIDVVTMDITMPNFDGIDCLKKIKEVDEKANVVMISSHGDETMVKKSLLAGARNYIVKPIERDKVIERILMAINSKKNDK